LILLATNRLIEISPILIGPQNLWMGTYHPALPSKCHYQHKFVHAPLLPYANNQSPAHCDGKKTAVIGLTICVNGSFLGVTEIYKTVIYHYFGKIIFVGLDTFL
jgi:hypothetical protein